MTSLLKLTDLPMVGYIRQAQLIPHFLPVSSATLWRMVKSGSFPKPVHLSARVTAWDVSSVRKWMEAHNPSEKG
jgi:prophage regulatory protein